MSATLWRRFLATAQERGNAAALRLGDRMLGFDGLIAAASGWARDLPLRAGDRVVIAAPNSIELAAAVPGIWARGAIPVFVNADAPDSHLCHAIAQTGATAVLVPPGREMAETGAAMLRLIDVAPASLPTAPDQDGQAPGSIVFTSGSTGVPKGVVQAAATLAGGVDRVAQVLDYGPDDSILCPIPFAFDYGWGQLLSLLLGGLPLVLPEPRSAIGIYRAREAWAVDSGRGSCGFCRPAVRAGADPRH